MVLTGKIISKGKGIRTLTLKGERGAVTIKIESNQELSKLVRETSKDLVGVWSNPPTRQT